MELQTERRGNAGSRASCAGFSLIELMMTVFIAGILLAVGIPALRSTIADSRLASQTNEMIAAINLARSQAITLNQPVTFCRANSEAATTCTTTAGNWTFWLVRTQSGTVVRRGARLATSLTISSTLTSNSLVFGSDGLGRTNNVLVTGGPHITVCSSHSTTDNRRQVTLGAGSRISTAKASGACS